MEYQAYVGTQLFVTQIRALVEKARTEDVSGAIESLSQTIGSSNVDAMHKKLLLKAMELIQLPTSDVASVVTQRLPDASASETDDVKL